MTVVATRSEIALNARWDVESVYTSPAEWEADFSRIPSLLKPVVDMRGKLTTPEALAKVFQAEDELGLLLGKLHLYAHMMEDVDTTVGENQARMGKIRAQWAKISGDTAYIRPEILMQSE
ncbi:MAG TPA: oligoendopeptidase F, partial [Candidatus Sumerlaeota bacterium]|nr:oligoendopeptidase F [Candidatus Sumerlaeota bacterium]